MNMGNVVARRLAIGALSGAMVMHESRGLSTASAERLKPPVAARVPKAIKFGVVAGEDRGVEPMDPPATLVDNYFWLRDDSRKDETILAHLRAENAFTEATTGHLAAFRAKLYDELLSRVQEDDDTPPYKLGDWLYFSRTVKGLSYRQYLRRPVGGGVPIFESFRPGNIVTDACGRSAAAPTSSTSTSTRSPRRCRTRSSATSTRSRCRPTAPRSPSPSTARATRPTTSSCGS